MFPNRRFISIFAPVLVAVLIGSSVLGLVAYGSPASVHSHAASVPHSNEPGALSAPAGAASDCSQGTHSILVPRSTPDLSTALLNDYDQLGAEGGGTIYLESGTYTLHSMLVFRDYSNVSIHGEGVGRTILSMPPDPVGNFTSNTGQELGRWNLSQDGPVDGQVVDFLRVDGPTPIDNFEICNMTIRAEANNATEDWDGSVLFDSAGGYHHVYENLALTGFYGPSTIPNGVHLESFSNSSQGYDYVFQNVTADNNTLPFDHNPWVVGGPNFLNVGSMVNCTIANVTGIGLLGFEVAPPQGCLVENVYVSGHLLIDPVYGGSWDNTLFDNVTIDSRNTAAPNAMGVSIPNPQGDHGYSNFTGMRWNHCTFYGNVLNGKNMIDVENSSFFGGINETPAIFVNNYVNMTDWSENYINLPIKTDGIPLIGQSSNFSGNTFVFPNSTFKRDPFVLHEPENTWRNDVIEIYGRSTGYLIAAPNLTLARTSVFSNVSYLSLGNGSPTRLTLVDLANSPHFVDLGATVQNLVSIVDNLPQFAPSPPGGLRLIGSNATSLSVAWDNSSGNVTNYTVYAGTNASTLNLSFSSGLNTSCSLTGLQPATSYYVEVVAWNSSFPSSPSASINDSTRPMPQYAPGVPSGVSVVEIGRTNVALRWNASSGNVTNYTVLWGSSPGNWGQRLSAGLALDLNVSGLASNATYFFVVMAWNSSWASGLSAPVHATTLPATTQGPGPGPPTGPSPPGTAQTKGGPISFLTGTEWMVVIVLGVIAGIVGSLAIIGHARARRRRRSRPGRRSSR